MEWVETVGKTLEEAKDAALEQLGVDVSDAEFVVLAEPKAGLFGRLRGEARVRARVRPTQPRPKRGRDRHRASGDGRRRATGPSHEGTTSASREGTPSARTETAAAGKAQRSKSSPSSSSSVMPDGAVLAVGSASDFASDGVSLAEARAGTGRRRRGGRGAGAMGRTRAGEPGDRTMDRPDGDGSELPPPDGIAVGVAAEGGEITATDLARTDRRSAADSDQLGDTTGRRPSGDVDQRSNGGRRDERSTQGAEKEEPVGDMTVQDQGDAARVFVRDLVARLGVQASVDVLPVDEETVTVAVQGEELGILVGPGGTTLAALQELTRTYVQKITGGQSDRIMVDVAGYRAKRVAALARFARGIAEEVLATGEARALEAMSPADRKVVHDTVNEIDGVTTRSEGEDDRRYVIIVPSEHRGEG